MKHAVPGLTCREAKPEDLDGILDLWDQLFSFHAQLDPIFTPSSEGRYHYGQWLISEMRDPQALIYVAELDEQVAGYIIAQLRVLPPSLQYRDLAVIADVCVNENSRGLHIGRTLYLYVEGLLKTLGVTRIEVKTSTFNPLSNHFWEQVCGFEEFVKIRYKELKS